MRVHLIEPGGRGGVYQHTVALARLLASHGLAVRLHTASDPEFDPGGSGVEGCGCVEWFRRQPSCFRGPLIAWRYLARTLPHLASEVTRNDVAHVQGVWHPVLTTLTLAVLGRKSGRTVASPHNTFARSGSGRDECLLRIDGHLVDATIVFSTYDAEVLTRSRTDVVRSPLVQLIPESVSGDQWRPAWGVGSGPVLLFAGQLRPDKRLDRVIDALGALTDPPLLAVVGEEKGAVPGCRALAEEMGVRVHWSIGFQPLDRFVAAIRAADVVVCPYERASQSGVLSIASSLGVPTVATSVGGLGEAADDAVDPDDPLALTRAIERAFTRARPRGTAQGDSSEAAWQAHAAAYGLNGRCAK
jgi:glycosyltransferase involved in cell wall biosynthesis